MFIIIVYIFVLCVYITCPLPLRLLILFLNCCTPDPIPIIDEVIMIYGVISKLSILRNVVEFVSEHKALSALLGVVAVIAIWVLLRQL